MLKSINLFKSHLHLSIDNNMSLHMTLKQNDIYKWGNRITNMHYLDYHHIFYISPIHEIFAFKKHNNHEITIVCIIKVSSESLYIQNMFYPLRSRDDHPFVGGSTGPVGWRSL